MRNDRSTTGRQEKKKKGRGIFGFVDLCREYHPAAPGISIQSDSSFHDVREFYGSQFDRCFRIANVGEIGLTPRGCLRFVMLTKGQLFIHGESQNRRHFIKTVGIGAGSALLLSRKAEASDPAASDLTGAERGQGAPIERMPS